MQTSLWKGRAFCFAVRWRCVCCSLAWFPKRPPPSFLSESLWLPIERAFKFKGLYFDFRLYFKWAIPISVFATTTSRANNTRSSCATTWLTTLPSGGYSAAPLPSSPETGLISHCESDKVSLLSLVRMTLTRNNHCERGYRLLHPTLISKPRLEGIQYLRSKHNEKYDTTENRIMERTNYNGQSQSWQARAENCPGRQRAVMLPRRYSSSKWNTQNKWRKTNGG